MNAYPPSTHRYDSLPAFNAEAQVTVRGKREKHISIVLAAVREHPGRTALELGDITGLQHPETQRRLSDLKNLGQVYQFGKATYQGRTMTTWYINGKE